MLDDIYQMQGEPIQRKIVFIGPTNSGKSHAIRTLLGSEEEVLKTIGCTHHSLNFAYEAGSCRLSLWDCAGSRHYEALIPVTVKHADAIVYFYNPYEEQCLQTTERWLKILKPLLSNASTKLYMVRSIRADQHSKPSTQVQALSWKVKARHLDINSADKGDVEKMLKEILSDVANVEKVQREQQVPSKQNSGGMVKGICIGALFTALVGLAGVAGYRKWLRP